MIKKLIIATHLGAFSLGLGFSTLAYLNSMGEQRINISETLKISEAAINQSKKYRDQVAVLSSELISKKESLKRCSIHNARLRGPK